MRETQLRKDFSDGPWAPPPSGVASKVSLATRISRKRREERNWWKQEKKKKFGKGIMNE